MKLSQGDSTTLRRSGTLVLFVLLVLSRVSFAAETALPQATAVYGAIATDPIYLWTAQEKAFSKSTASTSI